MKASELIKFLQNTIQNHGDYDIRLSHTLDWEYLREQEIDIDDIDKCIVFYI
jgi:hypothetical protein